MAITASTWLAQERPDQQLSCRFLAARALAHMLLAPATCARVRSGPERQRQMFRFRSALRLSLRHFLALELRLIVCSKLTTTTILRTKYGPFRLLNRPTRLR